MTNSNPIPSGGSPERPSSVHQPPPGAGFMNFVRWALLAVLIVVALASLGSYVAYRVSLARTAAPAAARPAAKALYRCPMHPSYTSDKPGECPICGMTLEKVEPAGAEAAAHPEGGVPGLAPIEISPERIQLIGVRTAVAQRGALAGAASLVGFVSPDESRLRRVQVRAAGWIQSLQVNQTGETVKAGQPMVSIYSPELYQSEQEYVIAMGDTGMAMEGHGPTRAAGRERLRLLGIPDDEIARLEHERTASTHITLRAPVTGTVLERNVVEGQYVTGDTPLFTVADLSRVWVLADVYEMDLARVRAGDRVRFIADGLLDRPFEGTIDFVYPTVSTETRTVKARIALDNRDGVLRPGMYGRVELFMRGGGTALTVPSEAVVQTGRESYVFLARAGGRFEPRVVWTGTSDGDRVQILRGLVPGDTVVASASFLIDSESRLKAAIEGMGAQPGMPDMPGMQHGGKP